jgi:hypothetical protein
MEQVFAIYCGERFRALLWGTFPRSTVWQNSAICCGANFRAVLCGKYLRSAGGQCRRSTLEQVSAANVGKVSGLYCVANVRGLLWRKILHTTGWQVFALYSVTSVSALHWGKFPRPTVGKNQRSTVSKWSAPYLGQVFALHCVYRDRALL